MKKNLLSKFLVSLLLVSMFLLMQNTHNVSAVSTEQTNNELSNFFDTDEKIMMYDSRTNETTEVNMSEIKQTLASNSRQRTNIISGDGYVALPSSFLKNDIKLQKSFFNPSLKSGSSTSRVIDPTQARYKATCRITSKDTDSSDYIYGTASLVGPNVALTAAHCVFNHDDDNKKYLDWVIYPAYNNGTYYPGASICGWVQVYYYEKWMETGDSNYDLAVCVLGENVGDQVEYYGVRCYNSNSSLNGQYVNLLGYPSDSNYGFTVNGSYQYESVGQIKNVSDRAFDHDGYCIKGFSGGPLMHSVDYFQVLGVQSSKYTYRADSKAVRITQDIFDLIASLR